MGRSGSPHRTDPGRIGVRGD